MNIKYIFILFIIIIQSQTVYAKAFSLKNKGFSENSFVFNFNSNNTTYETKKRYDNEYIYKKRSLIEEGYSNRINDDDEELRLIGWKLSEAGNHKEAVDSYLISLNINPNNYRTLHALGWSLAKLGNYDDAERAYEEAIKIGNNNETWRLLGWNFEKKSNQVSAIQCYKNSLEINPKNKKSIKAIESLNEKMYNIKYKFSKAKPHLNLRELPSTNSKKVGKIAYEEKIKVINKHGDWYLVKYGKIYGYVFSIYLKNSVNQQKTEKETILRSNDRGKFSIQLGSFLSNTNAANFAKAFKTEKISISLDKKTNRYVVTSGVFSDRDSAELYLDELKEKYNEVGYFIRPSS